MMSKILIELKFVGSSGLHLDPFSSLQSLQEPRLGFRVRGLWFSAESHVVEGASGLWAHEVGVDTSSIQCSASWSSANEPVQTAEAPPLSPPDAAVLCCSCTLAVVPLHLNCN